MWSFCKVEWMSLRYFVELFSRWHCSACIPPLLVFTLCRRCFLSFSLSFFPLPPLSPIFSFSVHRCSCTQPQRLFSLCCGRCWVCHGCCNKTLLAHSIVFMTSGISCKEVLKINLLSVWSETGHIKTRFQDLSCTPAIGDFS